MGKRLGTLIRHFLGQAVPSLAVGMVEPPLTAELMAPIGLAVIEYFPGLAAGG
jgi:hypothetical protein